LIAAVGCFVVTLMTRAKLVESTDYKQQKDLLKVVGKLHIIRNMHFTPLQSIREIFSDSLFDLNFFLLWSDFVA
jgi:myosin-crossreactive antigen